jgi:hypothetical protein
MSDYEDDGNDDEIDYNPEEDIPQDDEDNGGLNLEDNFLQAENAEDQIQAYKDIIDLEISNSNEKKWAFKSYEKLSIIYLKKANLKDFEDSIQNMAANYSKVEDRDKQDTIREICTEIKLIPEKENKSKFYQIMIKYLKEEGIQREYFYVGVELCKLYSLNKQFNELKKFLPSLRQDVDKYQDKEMVKNIKLELIIMQMQIYKHEGNTIEIKSLYLEANKLMKDQVFEDKFLVAIINEEGGKIAMRQKDFNKALEKFKFAFHYYRDMGNEEEAVTVLKYAFIVSLLVPDSGATVTKEETKIYSKHKTLMNLVNLFDAFHELDIKKIANIWKKDVIANEKDKFILENKDDIFYNIRINYIVRKLKAFKNCKIDMFEKELEIKNGEVLGMIMNIAKTQLARVKINFVKKQIDVLDDSNDNKNKLLTNFGIWLSSMK